MIGMSLSHCTGAVRGGGGRGVRTGQGGVCVQLLTPVIAARFDVFFNVVLCCNLFMYIFDKIKRKIKLIYGNFILFIIGSIFFVAQ